MSPVFSRPADWKHLPLSSTDKINSVKRKTFNEEKTIKEVTLALEGEKPLRLTKWKWKTSSTMLIIIYNVKGFWWKG